MRERAGWLARLLRPAAVERWRATRAVVAPLLIGALAMLVPGWHLMVRRRWCAAQQGRLRTVHPRVVWINDGEKLPWAFWGADHGFFELEWAYRLPYLRAAATP